MTTPQVTFLLPVYNAADTVADTVESILSQTYEEFELLIIDDASTDDSAELLATFEDPRIRIHRNETNLELARTLNRGLSLARGNYIARIDADDICLPHRAVTQVDFLDKNPHIAVVGSQVETFSDDIFTPGTVIPYPADPAAVAAGLVFRNTLAHPSVMLRKSALAGVRYNETIRRAQDYALWADCILHGLQLANIPQVLLRYRVHAGQATVRESFASLATGAAVRRHLLERLGLAPTSEQLAIHTHLALDSLTDDAPFLHAADAWLRDLLAANARARVFDPEAFARVLTGRYVALLKRARAHHISFDPAASPFAPYLHPGAL
jgi:glycosyltransferase involved in cell wall biosynthesis